MRKLSSNTIQRIHFTITVIGILWLVVIYLFGTSIDNNELNIIEGVEERIDNIKTTQDSIISSENRQWKYINWQLKFNNAVNDSLDIVNVDSLDNKKDTVVE